MRARYRVPSMVVAVAALVSCGGDEASESSGTAATAGTTDSSSESSASSTTTTPATGPRAGATYVGTVDGEPGLAATVTLVVAPSGVEITELMLELDLRDYACGDTTMSGGLGVGTEGPIAIDGGSFESSSSSVVWEGAFESELRAVGTVEGNIPDPMGGQGCDIGPLSWTAEPDGSATETEATEGTEAPTTTSTPTTGSAPEAEEAQERDEAELTTERLAAVDLADRFWGFTEDQKGAICSNFDADPSGEWMAFASSGGEASEAMFVEFVTDWCAADSIAPPEPPSDRAIEDFFVDLYADVLEDDLLRSEGCRLFVLDPSEAWAAQTEVDSFTDEDRPYTEAQFYSFQLKMCAFQL